ncbi:hypothetical protein ACIGNX_33640 [Actinosynnema sp. NPDC053489]|uniref:hypothetical protein n=1 Tax=Actinosynnema sp. NPDC053489 TaxID=3363916 RepID=UPI0037C58C51
MNSKMRLALAAVAIACASVAPATAAYADAATDTGTGTVAPQWFGDAHVTLNTSSSFGGWVDGNGPDSYQAYVYCSDGSYKTGATRWAGDRRGSFAYCASGKTRTSYGFRLIEA